MKSHRRALVALFLTCASVWSQTSVGNLSGTVRDRTGAVIPSVAVAVVNNATNVRSTTLTTDTGFYRLPGLVPGQYQLTAEMAGMQRFQGAFTVQVGQSVVIDAVLEPAGTATSVDVTALSTLVTTDSPAVGSVMERTQIEQLPINGRSLITLMQQMPGMEGRRAYGARHASLEFVLDVSQESERRWGGTNQIHGKRLKPLATAASEWPGAGRTTSRKHRR